MKTLLIIAFVAVSAAQKPYVQTVNPAMIEDSRCSLKKTMLLAGPVGQRVIIGEVTVERCRYDTVKYFDKNGVEIIQRDGWVLVDVE